MYHAQHVLGVPVLNMVSGNASLYDDKHVLSAPMVHRKFYTTKKETQLCPAMLWPTEADLVTVFIEEECSFAQAPSQSQLHVLQSQWHSIQSLIPTDSICHCVVYANKRGDLTMGVYDVVRLAGQDLTHESILERHARLHTMMQNMQQDPGPVQVHWIGFENACINLLLCPNTLLPFETHKVLRLEATRYSVVLKPIATLNSEVKNCE
jgi:hypothetical protein